MTHNPTGRVETHAQGAGVLTAEDLEARAREIAVINGDEGSKPSDEDRARAARELKSEGFVLSTDDATDEPLAAAPGSHLAADTGHKIQDRKPLDSQEIEEREVREGVREAEHDTMLTERTTPDRNE